MTGTQLKLAGMSLAAEKRSADLQEARAYLVKLAISRSDRCVSAEDVARWQLGNAAGSLFRGEEWAWAGYFKESNSISRHSGAIRVWKLK